MTKRQVRSKASELKAILSGDDDFLRTAVRTAIQAALEAEMTEALAAERSERVDGRQGYRGGFYSRSLITQRRYPINRHACLHVSRGPHALSSWGNSPA